MSVSETVARVRALREIVGQEEPKVTLGRFVVERELGRGGNGVVYEAVDPLSERPVALKVLSDVRADQLARFKREFRALELLAHPNVVDIYELGRADDEWFFAMELVRGTDLVRYVRAEADPARRVARLRRAFAGLVEGIAAIHGAGMLHRDLKPSNVVVDGAGRPVVLDLGMVGDQEEELPADGIVAGTPAYMSPEQGAGLAATEASDLYAVGVMLYELLAGGLPFEGSGLAPLRAKARQAAPPITAPSLDDPELAALCMALL
ncbi:MAG: serine/threonine protein kinase, partial [Deltaproteobacteria bacterium]|nr:serine/threonine protein kinase [Deltaproteobacteria bacterium]